MVTATKLEKDEQGENENRTSYLVGPSKGGNEDSVEVEVDFEPKDDNSPKARRGAVKMKVSPGEWCKGNDLEGTVVWKRFQDHGITDFLAFSHEIYPDLVQWFYKHPYEGIPTYEELKTLLNNDFTFSPGDNRKHILGAKKNFLYGDDKFALRVINECFSCTSSYESRVPDSQMVILYYIRNNLQVNIPILIGNIVHDTIIHHKSSSFPLGMLISYIVKSWDVEECGQPELAPKPIGRKGYRSLHLKMDAEGRHLLTGWRQGNPIERGVLRGGVPFPVGVAPVDREDAQENIEPQVEVHQEDDYIRVELSLLAKTQDDQARDIKKSQGYLRGIIKFSKCFGKGEGSRNEA
ncbi:hypothetical protein LIER_27833 [Lithospermum erythrorhizon]|uniref:Uncharacterized protein n=1 Tax=Lithospermum erythrorhizon TaxID=34254 RepID=A0AAV3RF56_LITER